MRYLVFGDIHANAVALDAVLAAADRHRVDAYLCVGDLVGYGPEPLECLARLWPLYRDQRMAWVAGNHDRVARGELAPSGILPEAEETLRWTRTLIEREPWAQQFLASGELLAKVAGGIWLTHDSLVAPGSGRYHRDTENAAQELKHLAGRNGRVAFYGHTHTMRGEVQAGTAVLVAPMEAHAESGRDATPLRLNDGERAWLGTGSVGFPKRRKGAAEFLVLDDQQWSVEKYAVAFSREEAKRRVRAVLGPVCSALVVERIERWL
ncbi:MAG: metallophosphoesterase family protein [Verrucomicrobiae bacterium]|nr:metallophosphoesterase family protein [Verrucomicrobiae bacterium]